MIDFFLKWIQQISPEIWQGAVIGTTVSALFATLYSLLKLGIFKARSQLPIRKMFGGIADNRSPCSIFLKTLYSHDRFYYSREPDFFPPHTTNKESCWQNIPSVVAEADMQAATDITNLLGQIGKRENITFRSVSEDWDLWSEHILSVGGNFKTTRIFEIANPKLVELVNNVSFRFSDSDKLFQAVDGNDYGLIYRVTHPVTGKICFVLIGLGIRGTEAAGYYLRTKAALLGKMFGSRDFAFLVQVRIDHGKETTSPCWYLPEPNLLERIVHPIIWYRDLKSLK